MITEKAQAIQKIDQNFLVLQAKTARDLMTFNPVTVHAYLTVKEATQVLVDRSIGAVPVTDGEGRVIGVLSHTDIVRYDREKADYVKSNANDDLDVPSEESIGDGYLIQDSDLTRVREIMTPMVFSVTPQTPVMEILHKMCHHHIHRLYVVDVQNILVGVITTMDILKKISVAR